MDVTPLLDIEALPPRRSLSRDICERIESAIVAGRLPPGMKLPEELFAEIFKVSRSPVREAIADLQKIGFAERGPQRDRRVTVPTESFIVDCFDVWVLLESERVYEASLHCDASGHARIDSLLQSLGNLPTDAGPPYDATLRLFHQALQQGCRNQQLQRICADWSKYVLWLRNLYFDGSLDAMPDTFREHQEIVALFKAKDRDGLVQVMRGHIRWQRDHILEQFQLAGAVPGDPADPGTSADMLRQRLWPNTRSTSGVSTHASGAHSLRRSPSKA